MIVRVQVIKVYDIDTGSGDTTDPESVNANIRQVENMQSTQIEKEGVFRDVFVENAEVVGPSDDDEE